MDNFRRYKPSDNTSPRALDGFVPSDSNSSKGRPTKQFDRTFNDTKWRSQDDIFDKPEGFHQSDFVKRASTNSSTMISHPENEVVDDFVPESTSKPKARFRGWRRKKTSDRQDKHKKRITAKRLGIATLVVVVLAGLGLGYIYMKVKSIFKGDAQGAAALQENPDPARLNGEGDGRVNILIMGKGGPTQSDGPNLTDTLMLASIDPVQSEVALLSVPRDLYVKDSTGTSVKINQVYIDAKDRFLNGKKGSDEEAEKAGKKALMSKVSEVLGVPMHYYVMVDFTAFQKAIDTVGGITIDVKEPVSEQMLLNGKPYYLNVKTGRQDFNGLKALAYARCRHCDARSDFGRAERQREIIIALKDKIFSGSTYSNPYKVQQLISTFGSNVSTDIGTNEIGRLYEIGSKITSDKIASVSLVDEPNVLLKTGMVGGLSVVTPVVGTYDYSEVQSFVRNKLKDSFLNNENARIAILNGTVTAGLAGKTTKELKSYGYNITKTANAPSQDYINTYVVDLTGGSKKYTLSYLEKRMQVTAVRQAPDPLIDTTDVDFVIIIGQNEANRQSN